MKLALAQILVEGGQPAANLERAVKAVREAAAQGAEVVLLPEALDFGWTHPSAKEEAGPVPGGASFDTMAAAARSNAVHVCAGLVERDETGQLHNAAILLDPTGRLLLHHRKVHELEIAHDLYARGDRLGVADTGFGRLGLHICADAFAPDQAVSRALALMGARVILSPCAWAVEAGHDNEADPYGAVWRENYTPVCKAFGLTIAGCSNVGPITAGPWAGRSCIGNSIVIDHAGNEILTGPYGIDAEALLFIDIET